MSGKLRTIYHNGRMTHRLGVARRVFFTVIASGSVAVLGSGVATTYLVTGNIGTLWSPVVLTAVLAALAVEHAVVSRYVSSARAFYVHLASGWVGASCYYGMTFAATNRKLVGDLFTWLAVRPSQTGAPGDPVHRRWSSAPSVVSQQRKTIPCVAPSLNSTSRWLVGIETKSSNTVDDW